MGGNCFNGATHSRAWKPTQTIIYGIRVSASMEPRTHARGNLRKRPGGGPGKRASMEPRTHARGNNSSRREGSGLNLLQWSHALTRVETRLTWYLSSGSTPLQWSHALTRVETPQTFLVYDRNYQASMEPRTHARGNQAGAGINRRARIGLQWSHALTRVETGSSTLLRIPSVEASMEPRTHARGN